MRSDKIYILPAILAVALIAAPTAFAADTLAPGCAYVDQTTIKCAQNLASGIDPRDSEGYLNVIVEIPRGTTAKWEVDKKDGTIKWEMKNGKPRLVDYEGGYPCNYGALPKTSMSKELGGDGDSVDVLLIGDTLLRGAVVKAKPIAVFKLVDSGDLDYKIVAAVKGSPEAAANNHEDLDTKLNGLGKKLQEWFLNYKGAGKMKSEGWGDLAVTTKTIDGAIKAYK